MSVVAAFNHACLEDLGRAPITDVAARLLEIARSAEVIRRGRAGLPIRVSRDLGGVSVGGTERFDSWANSNRTNPQLADALALLLGALSGPFVTDLATQGLEPENVEPSIDLLRSDLFELVWLLLHHGLSSQNVLWLLSIRPDGGVSVPEYVAWAAGRSSRVQNLRNLAEVSAADRSLAVVSATTYSSLLTSIEQRFPRIVFLDKARKGIEQFTPDCTVALLMSTFEGFDLFARLRDDDVSEEMALERYKLETTVDMSHESKSTLANPSLRALREAKVLGKKEVFSLHAKPGFTRVYIHLRKEPHPTAANRLWTRVYVGYCGKHLPVK